VSTKQKYSEEILTLQTQLSVAKAMKSYLEDPSKDAELIPVNTGLQDANINEQIAQYNVLKLRRDKLLEEGSGQNPIVMDVNSSLRSLKQSIVSSVDNVVVGLQTRLNEAKNQEGYALARMFSMPQKERELLSIERQQQIKEALYVFLLNKREENALTQAMVDNNAQIINDVAGSDRPIAPNRTKVLLLGFLLGLAIPGVWFLAKLFLDTRVQNRRDIKDNVTVPFLGEIPLDKEHQKKFDDAVEGLDKRGFVIDSTKEPSEIYIYDKACETENVGLVVILDYDFITKRENPIFLDILARHLDASVVVSALVERKVDRRRDKLPKRKDIKLEELKNQDTVVLVYRENYYINSEADFEDIVLSVDRNRVLEAIELAYNTHTFKVDKRKY
jgi:capsular polysaccharide biosynthesis protein